MTLWAQIIWCALNDGWTGFSSTTVLGLRWLLQNQIVLRCTSCLLSLYFLKATCISCCYNHVVDKWKWLVSGTINKVRQCTTMSPRWYLTLEYSNGYQLWAQSLSDQGNTSCHSPRAPSAQLPGTQQEQLSPHQLQTGLDGPKESYSSHRTQSMLVPVPSTLGHKARGNRVDWHAVLWLTLLLNWAENRMVWIWVLTWAVIALVQVGEDSQRVLTIGISWIYPGLIMLKSHPPGVTSSPCTCCTNDIVHSAWSIQLITHALRQYLEWFKCRANSRSLNFHIPYHRV